VAPLVGVAALLALTACGGSNASVGGGAMPAAKVVKTPLLEAAYQDCKAADEGNTMTLGDAGHPIIVDTGSQYGSVQGLACVTVKLRTSEAITAAIDSTTALMAVQNADDDPVHYQWSYHPDNGLNMIITSKS
jgi:hypothetical protein